MRIAEALGVTRGAVSEWLAAARTGGRDDVRRRPRGAQVPQLTAAQRAQLPGLLTQDAEASGFVGNVWTTTRVAEVIRREFGVRHHRAHVSCIPRAIGWTVQQPITRSTQRNEAALTAFREERMPSLQGKPARKAVP